MVFVPQATERAMVPLVSGWSRAQRCVSTVTGSVFKRVSSRCSEIKIAVMCFSPVSLTSLSFHTFKMPLRKRERLARFLGPSQVVMLSPCSAAGGGVGGRAGALTSTEHLTTQAMWELLLQRAEVTGHCITPLSRPSMLSKKTETSSMITNIQTRVCPGYPRTAAPALTEIS